MNFYGLNCCGGAELVGINDRDWTPRKYMLFYADNANVMLGSGKGFLTISYAWDVGRKGSDYRTRIQGNKRLNAFKAFIEKNKLGEVHVLPRAAHNPNYGHSVQLKCAIWLPNNAALRKYCVEKTNRKCGSLSHNGLNW